MDQSQSAASIASTKSLLLDLPPSCIEFCPSRPGYFVVGTYNLQKDDAKHESHDNGGDSTVDEASQTKHAQTRDGSLVLFCLDGQSVTHVQTVPYPSAILDLHFHPREGSRDVLVVVSSTGAMSFFRLSESPPGSHPSLVEISTQRPLDKDADVLLLSCAWHPSQHDILAITTSDFEVHVLKVDDDWTATPAMSSPAIDHALEAWTVAFSPLVKTVAPETEDGTGGVGSEIVIYSGGDDSKLLYRSCGRRYSRESDDEDLVETLSPTTNIRGHEAGVTAILPLDLNLDDGSSVVISGSYDDHIRVYAVPQFGQRAKLLAEENLDGGVWRLKLVNVEKQESGSWGATVLASCMHAGSRVVKIAGTASGDGDCKVEVLCRFEEHKSMNYGSDFQPGSNHGGRPLRCVSTSFYDRLLCFWTYDLPI